MRRLANFIDGEYVAPKSGRYVELLNPATGEPFAEMPVSGPEDVDDAVESSARAFRAWRRATPSQRSRALLRVADILEANAARLVDVESENCGKIMSVTLAEEIPPMLDQIRFFAGAARILEGRAATEYLEGMTSYIRREPIGVCAAVTPVELPDDDGGVEVGARHRRRQCHGAQTVGHHARLHAAHGRDPVRSTTSRSAERHLW